MKKAASIVLAIMLCTLLFAACGGRTAGTPVPAAQETQQSAPARDAAPAEPTSAASQSENPPEADAAAPSYISTPPAVQCRRNHKDGAIWI